MNLCIDHTCKDVTVVNDLKIPVPSCKSNFTMNDLPGYGSITGLREHLGTHIGDSAIHVVKEHLGITVSASCFLLRVLRLNLIKSWRKEI